MSDLYNHDFEEEKDKEYESVIMLLQNMIANQKESFKNSIKMFIFVIICYTIILVSMIAGFFIYESQFEIVENEKEEKVEEITNETTQTVSGDNAEINNVLGDQYNDNAIHNE